MPVFTIQEGLSLGLRDDARNERNGQKLVQLDDLIATRFGLRQVPVVTHPVTSPTLSMSWPHPQIMNGQFNKLLMGKTTIHQMNTASYGTATALTYEATGDAAPATSSNPWELASFAENVWFATNITNLAYCIPSNGTPATKCEIIQASGKWGCNSLANHNGRLVLGGVAGTLPSTLSAFFAEWLAMDHSEHVTVQEGQTLGTNCLVYSEMGGGARDVPFFAFMSMFHKKGGSTADAAPTAAVLGLIKTRFDEGAIGFYPLRSEGAIVRLLPLGNNLVAYTTSGVYLCRYTEAGYIDEEVLNIGVRYAGHVGGNEREHLFITQQNDLYRWREGQGIEKLNYAEYISTMTAASVVICHDPDEGYFTIADGTRCFTLTLTGFAKTDCIIPSSLARLQNYTGLAGTPINEAGTVPASLTTDLFDGGYRSVHEITYVNIATAETGTNDWAIEVGWRMNKHDAITWTTAIDFDDRGKARVNVSGIEFQIRLTADDRTKVDLDRIDIEFRDGGKRSLRQLIP